VVGNVTSRDIVTLIFEQPSQGAHARTRHANDVDSHAPGIATVGAC
jgi:hypothetical protein